MEINDKPMTFNPSQMIEYATTIKSFKADIPSNEKHKILEHTFILLSIYVEEKFNNTVIQDLEKIKNYFGIHDSEDSTTYKAYFNDEEAIKVREFFFKLLEECNLKHISNDNEDRYFTIVYDFIKEKYLCEHIFEEPWVKPLKELQKLLPDIKSHVKASEIFLINNTSKRELSEYLAYTLAVRFGIRKEDASKLFANLFYGKTEHRYLFGKKTNIEKIKKQGYYNGGGALVFNSDKF